MRVALVKRRKQRTKTSGPTCSSLRTFPRKRAAFRILRLHQRCPTSQCYDSAAHLCCTALLAGTCVLKASPFRYHAARSLAGRSHLLDAVMQLAIKLLSQLNECCSTSQPPGTLRWRELSPDRVDGVVITARGSDSATPCPTSTRVRGCM